MADSNTRAEIKRSEIVSGDRIEYTPRGADFQVPYLVGAVKVVTQYTLVGLNLSTGKAAQKNLAADATIVRTGGLVNYADPADSDDSE